MYALYISFLIKLTNRGTELAHKYDSTRPSLQSRHRSSRLRHFDMYAQTRRSILCHDVDALCRCRSPNLSVQDTEYPYGSTLSQARRWCSHDQCHWWTVECVDELSIL